MMRTWPTLRSLPRGGFALALLLASGCAERSRERPVPEFSRDRAGGAGYAERLVSVQRSAAPKLTDEQVIAAGYMERLRLGMGSPFRLMEYALRDPRLAPGTRAPLVWALLDATAKGRAYEIDPEVLARITNGTHDGNAAAAHLALVERTVRGAADPREGELAIREAYRVATASGAVTQSATGLVAATAALTRDRELARRDAVRFLAHAARSGKHPFALLAEWRKARRFEVEAPPGAPRAAALEAAAAARAVSLVDDVEAIRRAPARLAICADGLPRLAPATARRLATLARKQSYPVQSPIWITLQRYDEHLRRAAEQEGTSVERFLARARTEETLVAEQARLGGASPRVRELLALVSSEASVGMRTYAQERVWFPGFAAPSALDLKRDFGLRGVEFDADVPGPWRPYYRRMLGDALADMEVVLPSLDLRGATFRFGATGKEGVALAIHDPHGRTIHLPPESGGGAIAHEVGHDLDWQVAHARYGTHASYGTEDAVRNGRGDRFAAAVRRMPVPPEVPMRGGAEIQRRYAQRPAEIFARSFDGYVAAALAEKGRSNGYLTAAQDELLGGHGLALLPGARRNAAGPFMEMMTVASPVPDRSRREFLARWDSARVPTAFELADRLVADAAAPPRAAAGAGPGMAELLAAGAPVRLEVARVMARRDSALAEWSGARCANPLAASGLRGEAAVRGLVDAAAAARVRGIVLAHARTLGMDDAPAWLREAWLGAPGEPGQLFSDTSPACGRTG